MIRFSLQLMLCHDDPDALARLAMYVQGGNPRSRTYLLVKSDRGMAWRVFYDGLSEIEAQAADKKFHRLKTKRGPPALPGWQ